MTKTELQIKEMTEPIVNELGYSLYDVMYVKESSEWFLRFFIDKLEGKVDLDDCEKVSQKISDFLDEKDPISESYNLEVSSCGLERHLREPEHFKWAVGKNIQIKLYKAQNGKKEYEGVLKSFDNNTITIYDEETKETVLIDLTSVSMSKLLFNWEELENE